MELPDRFKETKLVQVDKKEFCKVSFSELADKSRDTKEHAEAEAEAG